MFLLFLEILCRGAEPTLASGVLAEATHIQMNFDATLMWGLSNKSWEGPEYRVNSLGLRGDALPDGGVRLLTLGDSSVYGHGVALSEVFSSVLASRLNASRGAEAPKVVPVIGAVPGYSTFQALGQLERLGPIVQPAVVIIGTMWSDCYRGAISDRAWSESLNRSYGPWLPLTAPLGLLTKRSALSRRLQKIIHDQFFPGSEHANEIGWLHLLPEPDLGGVPPTPPGKDSNMALPTARVPIDEYETNLHALAAASRALNAVPVFLLLPHPLDSGGRPLEADATLYREVMKKVAAAERATAIDAAAWFLAHPAEGRFSDDIHPSASGHADIATAAAEGLSGDAAVGKTLERR